MKFNLPKTTVYPSTVAGEYILTSGESGFCVVDPDSDYGAIEIGEILRTLQGFTGTGMDPLPTPPVPVEFRAYYAETFEGLPAGSVGDVGLVDGDGLFTDSGFSDVYLRREAGGWKPQIIYLDSVFSLPVENVSDLTIAVANSPIPFGMFVYSEFDEAWQRIGFPDTPIAIQVTDISEFLEATYSFAGSPIILSGDVVLVTPEEPSNRKSVYNWDGENALGRLVYVDSESDVPLLESPDSMEPKGIVVVDDPSDQNPSSAKAFIYDGYTNTMVQIGSGGGTQTLTFGAVEADCLTYNDLPTDVQEGAMAHHWTSGACYRLWKGGAVPVWVPARIYGVDGSTLGLTAWIVGDEANEAELLAHGWASVAAAGDANVQVVYEGNSILLKCSGATLTTNVVGTSSVTVSADITGWTSATRWWVYADATVVGAVASARAHWCRARDGVRNVALGSNGNATMQYWDWGGGNKGSFANQVLFAGTGNAKPASSRRRYEYAWEGSDSSRTLVHIDHEPEGGLDRGTMAADAGAAAWTLRAEATNNLRTNLRVHRVYLVTW